MGSLLWERLKDQQAIPGFSPNLFEVELYSSTNNTTDSWDLTTLYCTGYELPPPNVEADYNPLTKKHSAKKYTIPTTVTITWQEDSNLSVWKYHRDWLGSIYDRQYDVFPTLKNRPGKKRNVIIKLQKYSAQAPWYNFDLTEDLLMENFEIRLSGLTLKGSPPLRGNWNSDTESGSTGIQLQYYVDSVNVVDMKLPETTESRIRENHL